MNGTSRESGSRMGSLLGGGWTVLALAGLAVVYLCGEVWEVEVGPEEGCRDLIGAAGQAASCKEGSMTEGCIEYCLCVAHWCGPDGDPAACDDHCSAHPTDVSCGGWCEAHPETVNGTTAMTSRSILCELILPIMSFFPSDLRTDVCHPASCRCRSIVSRGRSSIRQSDGNPGRRRAKPPQDDAGRPPQPARDPR